MRGVTNRVRDRSDEQRPGAGTPRLCPGLPELRRMIYFRRGRDDSQRRAIGDRHGDGIWWPKQRTVRSERGTDVQRTATGRTGCVVARL